MDGIPRPKSRREGESGICGTVFAISRGVSEEFCKEKRLLCRELIPNN